MGEWMLAAALAAAPSSCAATSPAHTVALVELYTSQGCSSCPPADRWLTQLGGPADGARLVPIALHVGYWDYIGWKDPFAQRAFNERQGWLAGIARSRSVYTPAVFVGATEQRGWSSARVFDSAVAAINAQPARARIDIAANLVDDRLETRVAVRLEPQITDARLFVALTSSGQQTAVKAGENRGETLRNDHVARLWSGPLPLDAGVLKWKLPAGVAARDARLVAFVQREGDGTVLQALGLPLGACVPG